MTEPDPPVVTYWAISILSSRTAQFAALTFLAGALSLPEVLALIPLRYLPLLLMLTALVNFGLRTITVRPTAFIAPGATKPIEVARIDPPAPPVVTD